MDKDDRPEILTNIKVEKLNKNTLIDLRFYSDDPERSYLQLKSICYLTGRLLRLCVSDIYFYY